MSIARNYPDKTWQPRPGAARPLARVWSMAKFDVVTTLRNGEQLLLTLVIPLILLYSLTRFEIGTLSSVSSINSVTPSIIALAVMSTAFTSLAISVGFDRRAGALKLLGVTPLSRVNLVVARVMGVLVIEVIQIAVIGVVALLLGWQPQGSIPVVIALLLLGTLAFGVWGVALAGILRAEGTLAAANGIYLLLLLGGGIVIPTSQLPGIWGEFAELLPSGALADGLRATLIYGADPGFMPYFVMVGWLIAGVLLANRTFRWE